MISIERLWIVFNTITLQTLAIFVSMHFLSTLFDHWSQTQVRLRSQKLVEALAQKRLNGQMQRSGLRMGKAIELEHINLGKRNWMGKA